MAHILLLILTFGTESMYGGVVMLVTVRTRLVGSSYTTNRALSSSPPGPPDAIDRVANSNVNMVKSQAETRRPYVT
jgi:hypothetical protein